MTQIVKYEQKNWVIAFWSGVPTWVIESIAKDLQLKKQQKAESFILNETLRTFADVKFIGTEEKFYDTYPEEYTGISKRQDYRRYSSFEEIIEDFQWTKYQELPKLVSRVYKTLETWKGTFEEFCIKYKALTPDKKVTAMKLVSLNKNKREIVNHVPFAYPLFCAIKQLLEDRIERNKHAVEKSWEELSEMAESAK
jgi:hypothetical protein